MKVTLQTDKFPLILTGFARAEGLTCTDPHWHEQHWSEQSACDKRSNLGGPPGSEDPHCERKISANDDGGLSGGSSVPRPGSEGPHRR